MNKNLRLTAPSVAVAACPHNTTPTTEALRSSGIGIEGHRIQSTGCLICGGPPKNRLERRVRRAIERAALKKLIGTNQR